MYYGDDVVEDVRSRTNIVDLIGTYVSLKRAGGSYKGLCPFHNEKTPSFTVTPDKNMYYCFGCHKGGDVFTFLQEYENMTFSESVQYLAERAGIQLPTEDPDPNRRQKESLKETIFKINSLAAQYYFSYLRDPKGKEGMDYFVGRGLDEETMKKFALGFAPQNGSLYRFMKSKGYLDDVLKQSGLFVYDDKRGPFDKFWNRVMFPIVDRRNHVIGFGGRVMGDGKPKYMNSPETVVFDKGRNLFGINYIHGKLSDGLILCEGYMDVIALHQAGFTNAVAALGTAFTPMHAQLIKRMTDLVYVCFDSDQAGTSAAMKAIPMFKNEGIRTKVINMNPHKDPDEFIKALGSDEFRLRIKNALSSFFFEVGVIARDYDLDDPERKTKFMNEIAKKVCEFEDEAERSNYIDAFSREYHVRSEDFRTLVRKVSASRVGIDLDQRAKRNESRHGIPQDDALSESQGILLTWLCEHPESFDKVKVYVAVDDFLDEPYHEVAKQVYEQLNSTGKVDAASILGHFSDVDMQSKVAGIFHKEVDEDHAKDRAINEVVHVILKASLDNKSRNASGLEEVQKLLEEKKKLQQLHIDI